MIVDRVKYGKTVHFNPYSDQEFWEKFAIEGSVLEIDNPKQCLIELRQKINELISETYPTVIQVTTTRTLEQVDDKEFDELKEKLSTIEFYEEAEAYLNTTPFKMAVEAKKIINQKPHKSTL
jgi:hypothetical protein